jgi:hypothetical protein
LYGSVRQTHSTYKDIRPEGLLRVYLISYPSDLKEEILEELCIEGKPSEIPKPTK